MGEEIIYEKRKETNQIQGPESLPGPLKLMYQNSGASFIYLGKSQIHSQIQETFCPFFNSYYVNVQACTEVEWTPIFPSSTVINILPIDLPPLPHCLVYFV